MFKLKLRTRKDAINHIIAQLDAGNLGAVNNLSACSYSLKKSDGEYRYCAVGCLFNKVQLDDIALKGLNSVNIGVLAEHIGRKNVEYVTGLSLEDAKRIQKEHDYWVSKDYKSTARFRESLGRMLDE